MRRGFLIITKLVVVGDKAVVDSDKDLIPRSSRGKKLTPLIFLLYKSTSRN